MKKGQIEIHFHWIFVLIAGIIILGFFIGLVFYQVESSKREIEQEVVNTLDTVLVGALVAEKTKHKISFSKDLEIFFECDEVSSKFYLKEAKPKELTRIPLFSPSSLKGKDFIIWSLPYKLPLNVGNFLFLSSSNLTKGVKYLVFGNPEDKLRAEIGKKIIEDVPADLKFNFEFKDCNEKIEGDYFQIYDKIKIINLCSSGNYGDLKNKYKDKVSYTKIEKGNGLTTVTFDSQPYSFPSGIGMADPIVFAGIFAENEEFFTCNMKKVFERASLVWQVYERKIEEINNYYNNICALSNDPSHISCLCKGFISNIENIGFSDCQNNLNCFGLPASLDKLNTTNQNLLNQACITIY